MKIAVFGSKHHPVVLSLITQLITYFENKNFEFIFEKKFYDYVLTKETKINRFHSFVNNKFTADLILSFGGDGTFLKTAALMGINEIPILGINTGRLGFLTNFSNKDINNMFSLIEKHDFEIDERSLLEVRTSKGTCEFPYALNEVAIMKQDTSAMININTKVNGEPINTYRADGLIVATPTGSTAYSMSVGGPLVVPQANNFVISPIASHSLNIRPLIIPDSWELDLEIISRTNSYLIALDGRSQILDKSTLIHIRKANHTVRIVKQRGQTFFDTLKAKLMWGMDVRE